MSITGSGPDDPQKVGTPIADLLAGMYGAYGVLAALLERGRTGRRHGGAHLAAGGDGRGARLPVDPLDGRRRGRPRPGQPPRFDRPYGLFHCADGFVQIAVGSEGLWQRFCAGFDLDPATPGLATNGQRVANRERLIELVEGVFAGWKAADCWPGWTRSASRRARCGPSTRCTPGSRPAARAC